MGRRITAAALAAAGVVLLAGCGSTSATSGSSPAAVTVAPAPSPTPAANAYVASVMKTRGLGTAKASIMADSRIGGQERSLTATGGLDLNRGFGDLTWSDADGTTYRELSNGKGLFVQSQVPDGRWVKNAGVDASPTGRVADVLRGLGTLTGLRLDGTEVFQGLTFQRYVGTVPISPLTLQQVGIGAEDAKAIATGAEGAEVTVTVWVDPSGRVVRVDRSVDLPQTSRGPVTASTTTRMTEFSGDLDLSPPPDASVSAAPSP